MLFFDDGFSFYETYRTLKTIVYHSSFRYLLVFHFFLFLTASKFSFSPFERWTSLIKNAAIIFRHCIFIYCKNVSDTLFFSIPSYKFVLKYLFCLFFSSYVIIVRLPEQEFPLTDLNVIETRLLGRSLVVRLVNNAAIPSKLSCL